jgi:hypothetical protein
MASSNITRPEPLRAEHGCEPAADRDDDEEIRWLLAVALIETKRQGARDALLGTLAEMAETEVDCSGECSFRCSQEASFSPVLGCSSVMRVSSTRDLMSSLRNTWRRWNATVCVLMNS